MRTCELHGGCLIVYDDWKCPVCEKEKESEEITRTNKDLDAEIDRINFELEDAKVTIEELEAELEKANAEKQELQEKITAMSFGQEQ